MATKTQVVETPAEEVQTELDGYYSHLRTLAEVEAALAVRLPEAKLKKVNNYNYVPWEVTAGELDRIFGPFGWEEYISGTHFDTAKGIYVVTRTLSGAARNKAGNRVTIERHAIGRAVATGQDARAHDTAIAAADSDSFSRVAKKLGDAFGRYLYDRDDPANASRPAATGTVTKAAESGQEKAPAGGSLPEVGSNGKYPNGISPKQLGVFEKNNVPAALVLSKPYGEWKPALDSIFAGTFTGFAAEDEIPF